MRSFTWVLGWRAPLSKLTKASIFPNRDDLHAPHRLVDDLFEPFNDWRGRGRHKFVPVLGGDDTKIAPPEVLFDQPPGDMR